MPAATSLRGPGANPHRGARRRPPTRERRARPTPGRTASGSRPCRLRLGWTLRLRFGGGPLALFRPGHHGAQASADLLDLAVLCGAAQLGETRRAGTAFGNPFLGEHPVADVVEELPHLLAHPGTDDT